MKTVFTNASLKLHTGGHFSNAGMYHYACTGAFPLLVPEMLFVRKIFLSNSYLLRHLLNINAIETQVN